MRLGKDSLAVFRNIVDPRDPFVLQHETKSTIQRRKHVPAELKSETQIRALIKRVFPDLAKENQRVQAGRWLRVIQLHYKFHYSEQMTADEMGLSKNTIKSIKTHIRRALRGRRLDGSGCYWKKRRKK